MEMDNHQGQKRGKNKPTIGGQDFCTFNSCEEEVSAGTSQYVGKRKVAPDEITYFISSSYLLDMFCPNPQPGMARI